MRPVTGIAAALAFALPALSPALAEPAAPPAAQDPSTVPEAGDPEARRRMLNAGQAAAAQDQLAANRESRNHYEAATALTEMQVARDETRYADALTRNAEARQAYRGSRQEWERTNPHCWNGDAAQCPADPVPPPHR